MENLNIENLILFLIIYLIVGIIVTHLTIFFSKSFSKNISKIDYTKSYTRIIALIFFLVFLIFGTLLLINSTFIGILNISLGRSRSQMIGLLSLPVIIYFI